MDTGFSVNVRYYRLSEELQPYFTALYEFNVACSPGEYLRDALHPEWAAMRFTRGTPLIGSIGPGPLQEQPCFVVSGPTSQAIQFGITTSRIFGLGLQPAGWAKFVNGEAAEFANRTWDGAVEPAFALFAPIQPLVQDPRAAPDHIAEAINDYLMQHLDHPAPPIDRVRAVHDALRDPEVAHVAMLGERAGLGLRSLERICIRYFGFPPKLLLRRQRFLRSLARYMMDPEGNWSQALDGQYHDQAQFVRDFRSFMGMTPSEYAELPHPILETIIAQRMADLGAAPETDLPTVLRYRGDAQETEAPPVRRVAGRGRD